MTYSSGSQSWICDPWGPETHSLKGVWQDQIYSYFNMQMFLPFSFC